MIRRSALAIALSLLVFVVSSSAYAVEVGGKPVAASTPRAAPYGEMNLLVRADAIKAQFGYMDEKEFPQARNSDPKEFFDNSFVENLEKAGFFKTVGFMK